MMSVRGHRNVGNQKYIYRPIQLLKGIVADKVLDTFAHTNIYLCKYTISIYLFIQIYIKGIVVDKVKYSINLAMWSG